MELWKQLVTYLQLQFATMALLPVFDQHGYSITLFNGIEAVFDDLPSNLDTESSDYLFAVYNKVC